jgi:multiple sugar transport system substrate-binding protein
MSTFDWIGKSLAGRYQIQELVGQGGMSAVYKAYDTNLKRVVAIKMIHTHLSSVPGFVNRFEEEATAVAQLRHPNIVQVYDFNNESQTYYMVVEFIPGETLQDQLRRLNTAERLMPLNQVIDYMVNICQAADYAHNRDLIHRDIKPANIMLSIHKQAILMDFGIAKIVGGQQHTATGAVVGTALYMSPEQIMGQKIDQRSDIYALGVTLFEMVSGRPPFEADSAMTIMMMHINDPVPDLREINPEVPPELVAVINKALAKTPDQRYQTAGEMVAALKGALVQPAEIPPAVPPAYMVETLVDEPPPSIEQPEATAFQTPDASTIESTLPAREVQPEALAEMDEAAVPPSILTEAEKTSPLSFLGNLRPLSLMGIGAIIMLGLIAIIIGGLYFSGLFPGGNGEGLPAAVISPTKATTNTPAEVEIPAPPPATEPPPEIPIVSELNILWAQWDAANILQEFGIRYEAETGIRVNVIQEPRGSFYDRFSHEMSTKGDAFDMVVGDSQWLGQGATSGMYINLTDFLAGEGIAETITEASLTYSSRYPTHLNSFWAYPTECDGIGWAYRKDLFENPTIMAEFEAQYGYPLAVPGSYDQLTDIASFFTRPEENLYGVALYTSIDNDAITMGAGNIIFSWGGDWKEPETNRVMGVVNSEVNVEAVRAYRDLFNCCQNPELRNAFFAETLDAFTSGQAVMIMNYFTFLRELTNPDINPYAEPTGFFVNPAGLDGDQHAAMGGQALSVISYTSHERQEAALEFIRWFAQEEIQAEWARLDGQTCNKKVLESQEFLNATPYNPALADTLFFVKDFWNIPEYTQLLEVTQHELYKFIVEGQGSAREAMDIIAEVHETILMEHGYIE